MAVRKTFALIDMIEEVNRINRESSLPPAARQGCNLLLEHFLYEAKAYIGYGYVEAKDMGGPATLEGGLPGIVFIRDENDPTKGRAKFPDETRRVYYIHHSLKAGR